MNRYDAQEIKEIRDYLQEWDCSVWPDEFFEKILDLVYSRSMDALDDR